MKRCIHYFFYHTSTDFKHLTASILFFILLMGVHFSWYFYIRSYGTQVREIHMTLSEIHRLDQEILASPPADTHTAIQTLENANHTLEKSFQKLLKIRPAFNCIQISELIAFNLDYESNLIENSITKLKKNEPVKNIGKNESCYQKRNKILDKFFHRYNL